MSIKITVPPSKSISHRAVICEYLAGHDETNIINLGSSDDITATINGMKKIMNDTDRTIDCGESGSTLRFLIPIAACLSKKKWKFIGHGRLMERPMDVYQEIFKRQKCLFKQKHGQIVIKGKLKPDRFEVRGDISSQFITGLLFGLSLLDNYSSIVVVTPLESKPYVDLTTWLISIYTGFFIPAKAEVLTLNINGNQKYVSPHPPFVVEGDYSQAAFWLVAKKMGVDLVVEGLSEKSQQGDRKIVDILALPPSNLTIDTKDIPDLVPILAVYLSLCVNGTSKIINAARVRIKESDRLLAISQELNKLGAKITLLPDGLVIEHVDHLIGGTVDSWNDHRIAMSLAIASLKANGKVIITKPECVNKSYPDFWKEFAKIKPNE